MQLKTLSSERKWKRVSGRRGGERERRGATRILRGDRAADKKKQQPGVPGLVRNYLISQLIERRKI